MILHTDTNMPELDAEASLCLVGVIISCGLGGDFSLMVLVG